MRIHRFIFITTVGLALTACGATTKAFVSKDFSRSKYKNIAIVKSNDKAFADAVMTEFLGAGVSLIDRQNHDALLSEHQLSQGGTLDASAAQRVGKLAGADAIIVLEFQVAYHPSAKLTMIDAESGAILMSAMFRQTSGSTKTRVSIAEDFAAKIKSHL